MMKGSIINKSSEEHKELHLKTKHLLHQSLSGLLQLLAAPQDHLPSRAMRGLATAKRQWMSNTKYMFYSGTFRNCVIGTKSTTTARSIACKSCVSWNNSWYLESIAAYLRECSAWVEWEATNLPFQAQTIFEHWKISELTNIAMIPRGPNWI